MKTLIATLLATAAGATFAAPTFALNHDPATYRNVTQKAASAYQAATTKCGAMNGNDKDVCMAEAKLARTRTESDALSQYNNTAAGREKARTSLAEAEYSLAKARCGAKSGADKDDCMNTAKSVHTAALADAKSGANASGNTSTGASAAGATAAGAGLIASTDTRDQAKATAVDKCAQTGGDAKTGCLVQTKPSAVKEGAGEIANKTENAADNAGDKARAATATAAEKTRAVAGTVAEKTKAAASTAAEKTKEAAKTTVEKTKQIGSTVAEKTKAAAATTAEKTREVGSTVVQKTDNSLDKAGDKTRDAAATTADKTKNAGAKTKTAVADTAVTTKVKAALAAEPDLESLGIHVETEKGVVMLSGFVNSKAEADKAIKAAKGVEGATSVKSAIKVK
jgi:hyperosmotically inducible protein